MKKSLRLPFFAAFILSGVFLSVLAWQHNINLKFGKGLQVISADSSMHVKMGFWMHSLYEASRDLNSKADWKRSFFCAPCQIEI